MEIQEIKEELKDSLQKILAYADCDKKLEEAFAKSLIKILLFVALLAAGAFEYYQYSHRNEIACEDNGGRWNSERETCEEKSSLWQQVGRWLKN